MGCGCGARADPLHRHYRLGLRFVNILSAGVYALYYYNARSSISLNKLLGGLATLWGTLIVLGFGGVFFPEFRLRTPMSFIMPPRASCRTRSCATTCCLPGRSAAPLGCPRSVGVRPSAPSPTPIVGVWPTHATHPGDARLPVASVLHLDAYRATIAMALHGPRDCYQ